MAGLLDIAPISKPVIINGQSIDCYGVSVKGLASLINRFPELRMMFSGEAGNLTFETLTQVGPATLAAIIAAGTGTPNNEQAETIAAALPLEGQYDLLAAIFQMTVPGGVGPFVARLLSVKSSMDSFADSVESATLTSATKSPAQSNGSLAPDIAP